MSTDVHATNTVSQVAQVFGRHIKACQLAFESETEGLLEVLKEEGCLAVLGNDDATVLVWWIQTV